MKQIAILVKKEITDILRDKKTLVMMVVVPLLLYPLIIIGMSLGVSMFMQAQEGKVHTVGYESANEKEAKALERLYLEQKEELDWELTFVPYEKDSAKAREASDVWMEISSGSADTGAQLLVTLAYDSTQEGSRGTENVLEDLLDDYREELLVQNLEAQGLSESILHPVVYEAKDSASASESFGMDIGGSIGMMLMVTILLGAVYPAIDATAGEKERGTLETLLTLPVTNFQMIFSKFLSVSVFACVTALLSLLALGGSVLFLMFGVSDTLGASMEGVSLTAALPFIPLLIVVLIATALLATALCMCFCVFAKSFKEANNYVTPVLLIVMFASMVGMIPSVRLDYRTALIPVVNVSLMVKQMIGQQLQLPLVLIIIVVNFCCSILIAWVLAKLYDSEALLFSDGMRSFRLFQRRSEIRPGTVPAVGDVVICMTAALLLLLYVGSAVSVRTDGFAGTAVNQALILALPLLAVWYMKSDVVRLFSLRRPSVGKLPGSALLYLGTYCFVLSLAAVLMMFLPQSSSNLQEAFLPIVEAPLPLMLLVVAVMPAVGEELLFRGFLFGSLRERLKRPWMAILLSGFVFGVFHMSLVKLLPTMLLGILLAYLVQETGSIYVSMAVHFVNNAVSLLALKYPKQIGRALPFLVEERLCAAQIAGLLLAGALLAGVGAALLRRQRRL